jgi:hypothetical protein
MTRITGGCLCGKLRYEATADPVEAAYCHCRMCQRAGGGPVLTFAGFPTRAFRYVSGEPKAYRSSARAERRFCPDCGSSLDFVDLDDNTRIFVNSGTLDDPSLAPPGKHIWTMSQVSWFAVADDLPEHLEGG